MTTRRTFLRQSSAAAAGLTLAPAAWATRRPVPPSDQVNVGLIGCRSRGFDVLESHLKAAGVNCVALCDVDENVLAQRRADLSKRHGQRAKGYVDFRKMLEHPHLDAVIVGTPDHWHCLPTVYACEAGKDVYVEKPLANTIGECDVMVRAARRYGRVVQVGQQQRSSPVWQEVMAYLASGKLGALRRANMWANFNYGLGSMQQPDGPVPAGVNYDAWLGPAPARPFNPSRFHGSWRFFWDYGGGLMTDWGVHLIDMALWAKNITTPPAETLAYGENQSHPERARQTYATMSVVYPHQDYLMQWEHTAGVQQGPYNHLYGVTFVGDNGTLFAQREGWAVYPEWDDDARALKTEKVDFRKNTSGGDAHAQNFIDCVRSRATPACPVELGRAVALYAHAANLAVRTGRHRLQWDDAKGIFTNAPEANDLIRPAYRGPWELPTV